MPFEEGETNKVIDHDHVIGLYRGTACSPCNLIEIQDLQFYSGAISRPSQFRRHIICQSIGEYEAQTEGIKCIPQNMERYGTSVSVWVI